MASEHLSNILLLRISLDGIEPRIWRRVEVPDGFTLKQLHQIIQIVMGWRDSHLHEFTINGQRYAEPNPEDEEPVIDEHAVRLRDLALLIGGPITYTYDLGDNWQHHVVVEKKLVADPKTIYPNCIGGERSAPPEDVGGADSYMEFLRAIADPEDEDHVANLEWVGGQFDPEGFSITKVNRRLRLEMRRSKRR